MVDGSHVESAVPAFNAVERPLIVDLTFRSSVDMMAAQAQQAWIVEKGHVRYLHPPQMRSCDDGNVPATLTTSAPQPDKRLLRSCVVVKALFLFLSSLTSTFQAAASGNKIVNIPFTRTYSFLLLLVRVRFEAGKEANTTKPTRPAINLVRCYLDCLNDDIISHHDTSTSSRLPYFGSRAVL